MSFQISRAVVNKTLVSVTCALALTACGGGGSDSGGTQTVSAEVSGSVGDGPITGATVEIRNNEGKLIRAETSDNTASYSSKLRVSRKQYPLRLTVSDGIDLVTGDVPDFELVSVMMKPNNSTVNINPYSTLIVKMAEVMPGGVNDSNIDYAMSVIRDKFSFGLDPEAISNPITSRISASNIAQIVKASEAMGEMVRRTRDQLKATGQSIDGDDVMNAIAVDMADGFLDGMGAKGSDPTIAAVANVVTGQVLVETMTNTLRVNGVVATVVIDQAISTTHPGTRTTQLSDSVDVTASMLDQAANAVSAAQVVDTGGWLRDVASDIKSLSAGSTAAEARRMMSDGSFLAFDNAIQITATAEENLVVAINLTANNTPIPNNPTPDYTTPDEPIPDTPAPEVNDPAPEDSTPVEDPIVVNASPVLKGTPPSSVIADNGYAFRPTASDADGDTLSFSITNKPAWASFSSSTGKLSGTPSNGDVGVYKSIVISASDGQDAVSLPAFSVEVVANVATTGNLELSWTAPSTRADGTPLSLADINGFRIYYGESEGSYTESVDISDGSAQSATVTDIPTGSYHVVMTTYDNEGRESGYSAPVVKSIQ